MTMNIWSMPSHASLARLPRLNCHGFWAIFFLMASASSHAVDFGPDGMFSLNGFVEVSVTKQGSYCANCQWAAGEGKQRDWADAVRPDLPIGNKTTTFYQAQPYLGFKRNLGGGYTVSGLLSQRWRDGFEDVPGFLYEKNLALSHEDFGTLRLGSMLTRAWSVADYPYGTNVGLSSAWGSSGAGYGMLTNAIRYTSRLLDVADGDLVLEATYDRGNTAFVKNRPNFVELYAQYHKGDLVIDAMLQDAKNGTPSAWSHGPFTGLTPFPADDAKLSESRQSIAMVMSRYQVSAEIEVSGGLRYDHWSGANAVQVGTIRLPSGTDTALWNDMFNVEGYPGNGYPANAIDLMVGARYRVGKWVTSAGLVHLGKASTANPKERGQRNSALINAFGLQYDYGNGLKFNATAGFVHYAFKGLAPMSMPDNAAFTNVDSRVSQDGRWLTVGVVYGF